MLSGKRWHKCKRVFSLVDHKTRSTVEKQPSNLESILGATKKRALKQNNSLKKPTRCSESIERQPQLTPKVLKDRPDMEAMRYLAPEILFGKEEKIGSFGSSESLGTVQLSSKNTMVVVTRKAIKKETTTMSLRIYFHGFLGPTGVHELETAGH